MYVSLSLKSEVACSVHGCQNVPSLEHLQRSLVEMILQSRTASDRRKLTTFTVPLGRSSHFDPDVGDENFLIFKVFEKTQESSWVVSSTRKEQRFTEDVVALKNPEESQKGFP